MSDPGREADQLSPDEPGSATVVTAVDETPTSRTSRCTPTTNCAMGY